MADEIAQVVEMEYKGVYYLFKGTKATIQGLVRFVKAMHERNMAKQLAMAGSKTWTEIQKISEGTPPILEFPKEMFEKKVVSVESDGTKVEKSEFELYCEAHELRYCIMPDLNPNDDYIPVAVPLQDIGVHQEQIKAVMSRRIQAEEDQDKEYDEKISLVKEKIQNATNDKDKAELEAELNMLLDAKEQNKMLLEETKEKLERDNVLDFATYLQQGEGTLFETDPSLGVAQEEACGMVVREYKPDECMWPVREEGLIPESGEIFYSQKDSEDQIHVIRREFIKDEQGRIYSEYHIRIPGSSNEETFSDYGHTRESWEKEIPKMLKDAGFVNGEPTAVVQNEERLRKYQEFMKENFKQASESQGQEKEYSSKDAQEFVDEHNRSVEQRKIYEEAFYEKVTVPIDNLMTNEEDVLCLDIGEGVIKGVMIDEINQQDVTVFIKTDAVYEITKPDGKTMSMDGADIVSAVSNDKTESFGQSVTKGRK